MLLHALVRNDQTSKQTPITRQPHLPYRASGFGVGNSIRVKTLRSVW